MPTLHQHAPVTARPIGHAHVADLDACLDFINSLGFDDGRPIEYLPTAEDGVAYFVVRGLAHEASLRAQAGADGDGWLRRIHGTREALREVWDAQVEARTPAGDALERVNDVLRHAPRFELIPGPDGVGVGHRHTADDPTGEALARVVEPLVDEIASGATDRFRICANDGCRWVFKDTSRGGRRRWCDAREANRAKVRRFRSKARATTTVAPTPGDGDRDQPPAASA